jgi:hypothetical protein
VSQRWIFWKISIEIRLIFNFKKRAFKGSQIKSKYNRVVYRDGYQGNQHVAAKSITKSKGALLKSFGKDLFTLNTATSLAQFNSTDGSGEDWARLTGASLITGSVFTPVIGPLLSISLGVADSFGILDDINKSFD